jgi:RimJ/RimL family protein N-acetyltransferase/pimeloyl-ACP methyl ester carboxylesterase
MALINGFRLRKIQYEEGPVWLFLPGGPGLGSEYLESLTDAIFLPGSVFLLDFPGDGSNPTPLRPEDWRQGLLKVVQSFQRVHLVGHSFGAMFIMTCPELEGHLDSLVLMSGSPKKLSHADSFTSNLKKEFSEWLPRYVNPSTLPQARELFKDLPFNDEAFKWGRDHFHPEFHPTYLPKKTPTLILNGEKDLRTPISSFQETPYIDRRNILIHSIEGAAHFPWLDDSQAVNRTLLLMCEPVLMTERLMVRRFHPQDLDDVAELLADPQVMRYSLRGSLSRSQADEYLNERIIGHYRQWGVGPWGVYHKENGEFLGMAGLLIQEIDGERQPEIAYRFLPRHWKKGYATEAGLAIRDWGFAHLHTPHLVSVIEPDNFASIQVAKRLGMCKIKDTQFHGFQVGLYRVQSASLIMEDYDSKDL